MARIWECEQCGSRKKGPDRPRRNSSVRYCFPCSDTRGKLVERRCPSLDRQRAAKKRRREVARERARQVERAGRMEVEGVNLMERLVILSSLPCWSQSFALRGLPELSVRWTTAYPHGVSGSARDWDWRICMTIGVYASYAEAEETLIHEMAHLIAGCEEGHSNVWKETFRQALRESWGVEIVGRSSSALDVSAQIMIESCL